MSCVKNIQLPPGASSEGTEVGDDDEAQQVDPATELIEKLIKTKDFKAKLIVIKKCLDSESAFQAGTMMKDIVRLLDEFQFDGLVDFDFEGEQLTGTKNSVT